IVTYPTLPSLEVLTEYRPKIPLRIYSSDEQLIGEFGEERRALVKIEAVPERMRQAIVAAEDERFYQHGGVDYLGVLRAAYSNFMQGGSVQGASTLTMQVARNFFLTKEKTYSRKFNEVLLAFKIENNLSKDEILELYINQIYLGQRAYGFAAAARTYFDKTLSELNLAETAMLAGLPKAPSRDNPVANKKRAEARSHYVLRRMLELGFISDNESDQAIKTQVAVRKEQREYAVPADYFAEMARQAVYERFQEEAYEHGFRVYTTLDTQHQQAAYDALRKGVYEYDRRHGYRGPQRYVDLPAQPAEAALNEILEETPENDELTAGVVLEANAKLVKAHTSAGKSVEVTGDGLKFVQKALSDKAPSKQRIRRGAIIYLEKDEKEGWRIRQMPEVEAAFVSVDPNDGAVLALVGGFDFNSSKFNHVTQALRQPGSSFKPFIYSAALEKGFTAATIVNDAPLAFDAIQTGSEAWEPKNYEGNYSGPMRLRTALAKSKNLVSIRILQAIDPQYAQDYITHFGFDPKLHPAYLTMALGAGSATPLQMAVAYSVFANGGYRVSPNFIKRIEDPNGRVLFESKPLRAGEGAERAIDERNAFIVTTLMQDVVKYGTGARAAQLGRKDLAGKTGTTNEQVDAWFAGFQRNLVAVAWIGFDNPHSLGGKETGAQAALPIWMAYMGEVLKGVPEAPFVAPDGVAAVNINPETGLREPDQQLGQIEYFYHENIPPLPETGFVQGLTRALEEIRDQLF
ncbi:MAG: penicillin-binding protein 1A, partial [Burkholderiales bacterium]